ncbi:ATP-binding protein [Rhodoferax koreense]|uniref:ATP-binding protein n=1 Tax=Rhodoferax koreensis TaxID=1842727 RepID=UPI001EF58C46|nr:ATP-binding protein [Rhodoferax koreense]
MKSPSVPFDAVTLENCDREPIHTPAHIQPHGVLFAFDHAGVLTHRSDNAAAMLGGGGLPALGEMLSHAHFTEFEGLHELLQRTRESAADGDVIPHATEIHSVHGDFDVVAHRTESGLICEFESRLGSEPTAPSFAFTAHRAMEKLKRQHSIEGLLSTAVEQVASLTGFDRVMAYRFRHDESGDVVAETVRPGLDLFLGRRYPASDIPAQARRLYVINTLRLIADVGASPVPVTRARPDAPSVDMSHGVLRSVSPVHIEYLGNMGVAASMSVSIVIGGRLWGMLACHHMQPRRVSYTVRMACDVLAQILASNLQGALAKEQAVLTDQAASLRSRVVERVLHADDLIEALSGEADALCAALNAPGLLLAQGGNVQVFGGVAQPVAAALVQWLNDSGAIPGRLLHMDSLAGMPEPLALQMENWTGLLALPFGEEVPSWLVLLRKEQIETIHWGGKPEKEYRIGPLGPRLTPRGSFELWRETVRGKAVPWSATEIDSAQKLLDELMRADAAHMAELRRARAQLMAMLGHDLRDPLQSIADTATLLGESGDRQISRRLQSSSSRMQRLVTQVLDMSRMHGGVGLSFNKQPVDLVKLLEGMLVENRRSHPGMEIQPIMPRKLMALVDGERIGQVVAKLLSNASRYGVPGEPVLVELHERGGMVVLEVSNTGQALDETLAANMFLPFKRKSPDALDARKGLGLGLYIAHQVLEGHGGTLSYSYAEPYVVFTAVFPAGLSPENPSGPTPPRSA